MLHLVDRGFLGDEVSAIIDSYVCIHLYQTNVNERSEGWKKDLLNAYLVNIRLVPGEGFDHVTMDKNLEKRSFFVHDRNQQNVLQETRLIKDIKQAKKNDKRDRATIRRSSI
ncbi:hypothetical protein MKW98_002019 [Papaver atlanticum]|uniref:Uncharacterized protein n=1 Tax=Papaver atlanticum TaxID=357466 RepID=A0AAD4SMP3_9MAGN|nr:hypothetical protein MKW98_002019 [Papaver atlanticum]